MRWKIERYYEDIDSPRSAHYPSHEYQVRGQKCHVLSEPVPSQDTAQLCLLAVQYIAHTHTGQELRGLALDDEYWE